MLSNILAYFGPLIRTVPLVAHPHLGSCEPWLEKAFQLTVNLSSLEVHLFVESSETVT